MAGFPYEHDRSRFLPTGNVVGPLQITIPDPYVPQAGGTFATAGTPSEIATGTGTSVRDEVGEEHYLYSSTLHEARRIKGLTKEETIILYEPFSGAVAGDDYQLLRNGETWDIEIRVVTGPVTINDATYVTDDVITHKASTPLVIDVPALSSITISQTYK